MLPSWQARSSFGELPAGQWRREAYLACLFCCGALADESPCTEPPSKENRFGLGFCSTHRSTMKPMLLRYPLWLHIHAWATTKILAGLEDAQ